MMKKLIAIFLMAILMMTLMVPAMLLFAGAVETTGYSDADLCWMARNYCIRNGKYVAEYYVVEQNEGDMVTIRAFDLIEDYHDDGTIGQHMATSDRFMIDRKTGVGVTEAGRTVTLVPEKLS